jgi:type-F conjugative transfer system secretin TraK
VKTINQKNQREHKKLFKQLKRISRLITFSAPLFILLQCVSTPSYALQAKSIKDNGTAYATISTKGLTRIAVDNDRILDIKGPSGVYTLQNDSQQGAVYLKLIPNSLDATNSDGLLKEPKEKSDVKPFSVFIATEQNHNYVLKLTPRNQSADTILLKPIDAFNQEAVRWESTSPYTEAITDLMSAMVKGKPPEGYGLEDVSSTKKQYLGSIAYARLVRVYSGAHLQGQVYELNNRTAAPLHVTESEFYKPGDRAISLSALNIDPAGQVLLYKVTSHDE